MDTATRRTIGWMMGYLAAVVVVSGITTWRLPPATFVFQVLVLMPILLMCAASPGLRRVWAGMGRGRQIYTGVSFFCVLLGVVSGAHRATYPFISGTMYGQNMPGAKYIEYRATFASGRVDEFPALEAHPAAGRALMSRFIVYGDEQARAKAKEGLGLLIDLYNRQHPDDPVRALDVFICQVLVSNFTGPESIQRRHLFRMETP